MLIQERTALTLQTLRALDAFTADPSIQLESSSDGASWRLYGTATALWLAAHIRVKPMPKQVPLTVDDIVPNMLFRYSYQSVGFNIMSSCDSLGVSICGRHTTWGELIKDCYMMKYPNATNWVPCSKEEK